MGNSASVPLRVRRRRNQEDANARELLCTKPSGLYPTCAWDVKLVRRLILRGELAPRYPGRDDPTLDAREECPICMLVYPVLNETRCCAARLCTECYLQIRPPRHNKEPCPFCKYKRVEALYKGPRDQQDLDREAKDELRALEAMKRANVANATSNTSTSTMDTTANSSIATQRSSDPSTTVIDATSVRLRPDSTAQNTPMTYCRSCGTYAPLGCTDPLVSCACTDGSQTVTTTCSEDHRAHYLHASHKCSIDPLVLEAMASEVTYSNAGLERGSASSSGVLDAHTRDLHAAHAQLCSCGPMVDNVDALDNARPPRVVRLPWHGVEVEVEVEVSTECAGPSAPLTYPCRSDELFHEDEVSLNEAIRRSLVDM